MYKKKSVPVSPIIFYKPEKEGYIGRRRRRGIKLGWNMLKINRDCFRNPKELYEEDLIRKKEKEEWLKTKSKLGRMIKRKAKCEKFFEAKGRGRVSLKKIKILRVI